MEEEFGIQGKPLLMLRQRGMVRMIASIAISFVLGGIGLVVYGKLLVGVFFVVCCPVFVWLWLSLRKQALAITDSNVYSIGGSFKEVKARIIDSVAWVDVARVRYVIKRGQNPDGLSTVAHYLMFDRKDGGQLVFLTGFPPNKAERAQLKQICEEQGVECTMEPEEYDV